MAIDCQTGFMLKLNLTYFSYKSKCFHKTSIKVVVCGLVGQSVSLIENAFVCMLNLHWSVQSRLVALVSSKSMLGLSLNHSSDNPRFDFADQPSPGDSS